MLVPDSIRGGCTLGKEIVDWKGLEAGVAEREWTPVESFIWWYATQGETAYEKLPSSMSQFIITQVITGCSKKWWDEEVVDQVRVVRHEGQKGHNHAGRTSNRERELRWRVEAEGDNGGADWG